MTELVRYEAARRALAEAVAVDEVAGIRSQAEALRYAARIAGDKQLEIQAAQIRFRAERKMGELLAAASEAGQLRRGRRWDEDSNCSQSEQLEPEDRVTRVTLQEAGIDRKLSSRAQKMAAMDVAEFEQALEKHAAEMRSGQGRVSGDDALAGLLHDGSEAYLLDMLSPIKQFMPDYKAAEKRCQAAVYRAFGLPEVTPPAVKLADRRVLRTERMQVMADTGEPWVVDSEQPLDTEIVGLAPLHARGLFLERFAELTGIVA